MCSKISSPGLAGILIFSRSALGNESSLYWLQRPRLPGILKMSLSDDLLVWPGNIYTRQRESQFRDQLNPLWNIFGTAREPWVRSTNQKLLRERRDPLSSSKVGNTTSSRPHDMPTRTHGMSRLFVGDVVCSGASHPTPSVLLTYFSPLSYPHFSRPTPRLTRACLGHHTIPPPPDSQELKSTMLPLHGHAASPRSLKLCFSPLLILSSCLDAIGHGIDHWHGVVNAFGPGVDKGHGKGPWDDISGTVKPWVKRAILYWDFIENYIDVDMRARTLAGEEWMVGPKRELHEIRRSRRQDLEQRQYMWRHRKDPRSMHLLDGDDIQDSFRSRMKSFYNANKELDYSD